MFVTIFRNCSSRWCGSGGSLSFGADWLVAGRAVFELGSKAIALNMAVQAKAREHPRPAKLRSNRRTLIADSLADLGRRVVIMSGAETPLSD
jgi:hypothetical protein